MRSCRAHLLVLLGTGLLATSCGSRFPDTSLWCAPAQGCACAADSECWAAVDCCDETNWCGHASTTVSICAETCPEQDAPQTARCVGGRCACAWP